MFESSLLGHEHEQVLVRTDHLVAVHELERAVALLFEVLVTCD
jgi:hypothetical protein